jgi:hypothetical protein
MGSFLGIKGLGREADFLPPFRAKDKNGGDFSLACIFMA